MMRCPRCGSDAEADPEFRRVVWCLACWHTWALPGETACPGHRPVRMAALRILDECRDLRR